MFRRVKRSSIRAQCAAVSRAFIDRAVKSLNEAAANKRPVLFSLLLCTLERGRREDFGFTGVSSPAIRAPVEEKQSDMSDFFGDR